MKDSSKKRAGEILMLVSFLSILAPLFYFSIPTVAFAGVAFLVFLLGFELYVRNRKHWNEV